MQGDCKHTPKPSTFPAFSIRVSVFPGRAPIPCDRRLRRLLCIGNKVSMALMRDGRGDQKSTMLLLQLQRECGNGWQGRRAYSR